MMKLFGRGDRQAQLQDLYRAAEHDGEAPARTGPELQRAFAADQQLMRQLGRLAAQSGPVSPAIGRATLLAEVARKKSDAADAERRPMIGQFLTARVLALLATAGIFAGGAVTVGASGGISGAAGNVQNVLATLRVIDQPPDRTDTQPNVPGRPEGSGSPSDATPGVDSSDAEQQPGDSRQPGPQDAGAGGDNPGGGIADATPRDLDHANQDAPDATPPASLPAQADEHTPEGAKESDATATATHPAPAN